MRQIALPLFLCVLAFGCTETVRVSDSNGEPIVDAAVAPVTLSMNGRATFTDRRGKAKVAIRIGVQDTKWVNVSKPGYQSRQVPVPAEWPLEVVLERSVNP